MECPNYVYWYIRAELIGETISATTTTTTTGLDWMVYILSLLVHAMLPWKERNTATELRRLRDIGFMCYQNDIEAVYFLTRD